MLSSVPEAYIDAILHGAHVRRLTVDDAELVNKHWARGRGLCLDYVALQIQQYGGYGVQTCSGDLVSWVVRYETEEVGMGHTLEQHRKKGYMRAVIREVLRDQRRAGVETTHFYTNKLNKAILSMGAADGFLLSDNASNPSFVVATVGIAGQDNTTVSPQTPESYVVASDIGAAARVLPQGNELSGVPEHYIDRILQAQPGTVDPRPEGYLLLYRSLADGGFGVETSSGDLVSWAVRLETEAVGMRQAGVETSFLYTHRLNKAVASLAASEGYALAEGLHYWVIIRGTAA
eukprot:m51a1_g8742 hypothetical protein (290) ;mRNA; f:35792-38485